MHARVQKIAAIKAMLPVKPRAARKPAGNQYLGSKAVTRAGSVTLEVAQKQQAAAAKETEQQFVDGAQDMLLEAQQVEDIVEGYCEQVGDDEADDAEYDCIPGTKRCKLADLFVGMRGFDLNLLFEDEVDPEAS